MESKIIGIFFLVVFSILVSLSSSESNDEEFSSLSKFLEDQRSEFELQEETRSDKECIPRNHDCTSNRHGCCRGKMFKDHCVCFYKEGNDTLSSTEEEVCSCQQPWYHETTEDVAHKLSGLKKFIFLG
ncbi:hypothetical protein JTE90_009545 [Oedothorax gibbosus]|uniref:Uncharacterized protein n=1 Tax=Oedothorax gibbosus TaxID=931172 RepID=A0AAV6UV03_9ARAC|nr:hypothetical protein JTE90_009545 [Oedothorax gibbosus]